MLDALAPLAAGPLASFAVADLPVADLTTLAKAEFVPPDDWRAQAALPLGILFLFGGIFMLLRANLGTRRAYLLQASSFFGFMVFLSAFWAWGIPGTPQFSGPTSLPGQPPDFLEPEWVAFAEDSNIAQDPTYDIVQQYPEGFQAVPDDMADEASSAADEIVSFFSTEEGGEMVEGDWVQDPEFTPAMTFGEDDRLIIATQVREVDEETGEADPEGDAYFAFALFDEGAPGLPSYLMLAIAVVGFVLHVLLLGWDEREERRHREEDLGARAPDDTDRRVPTPA